jgi:hypothetical protein
VLVLVPTLHKGIVNSLQYARGLSVDVRAIHIDNNPADTRRLMDEWENWSEDIPLVVLPSPYRSIIGPLLAYLNEVERERPEAYTTVIVPEFVTGRWWHTLLHANYGAWIKLYLLRRRHVIVTNVRYFVEAEDERTGAVTT